MKDMATYFKDMKYLQETLDKLKKQLRQVSQIVSSCVAQGPDICSDLRNTVEKWEKKVILALSLTSSQHQA